MWFKFSFRMLSKTLEKLFILEYNMAFVYRSNIDPYLPRKTPGPGNHRLIQPIIAHIYRNN